MLHPSIHRALFLVSLAVAANGIAAVADVSVGLSPAGGILLDSQAPAVSPQIRIFNSGDQGMVLDVHIPSVLLSARQTELGEFQMLSWPDAGPSGEIGSPALPVVRRLFIAPHGATVTVSASAASSALLDETIVGFPIRIMPRQAPVEKLPGALERAPFDYDASAYAADHDYLSEVAVIEEAGIARGRRLFLLEVHPVAYNPARGTLEFRDHIQVDIAFSGGSWESELRPLPGLHEVVLNPESLHGDFRGMENYLIITASTYLTQAQQFAAHKQAKGFNVTTYTAASSSATTIKNYIQTLWGTPNAPDYILLVGDTQNIGYFTGGGAGNPATDLQYTCMDGASDWYPDIALGRFPVDDTSELSAVLAKTIAFDNREISDPGYFDRAVFMASEDNYTVSEGTHNWVINTHMTPNGIVSNKLYCHTYGATTQQVRNAFNNGRFYGIYSGHGDTYYWADGPVFYQSDVRNLTNAGMYSFVLSFACITGTYTVDECFTETWLLVPDKGAVGIWGSSVNSYWTEDDVLERRWFDSIYDDGDNVPARFGPVFNEARMRYLAQMGSGSTTRRYFEMYNLMGDPSLPILEIIPPALIISLPQGVPTSVDPGVPSSFTVSIQDGDEHYQPGTGILYYRYQGGAFQAAPLTPLGGNLYQATLPPAACADAPQFYIGAVGDGGTAVYEPQTAPQSYYTALVGDLITIMQDNFNSDQGWTVQNSSGLTAGAWQRGIPAGGGTRGDPPTDYDGSGYCYLTGNTAGDSDVDGGYTWLISPTINLSAGDADISFALWYTNDYGADPNNDLFKIYVSNNNGSTWTLVETVGPQTPGYAWFLHTFRVGDFVTPNATVKVRFEASDVGSGSVVEAGVDAFKVVTLDCTDPSCPGDLDGDYDVDIADLAQLLAHYGMTGGATYADGDLDGDSDVDLSDLAALLAVYGESC